MTPSVRILVVDDYGPWPGFVLSTVRNQPQLQIVGEASDGLAAVKKAEELQPDLILLDIGLPALDGIGAAKRINQVAPTAKILFVSQSHDQDVVREALSNGARGYVLKENGRSELLPAIETILRGETFVSKPLRDQNSD